MSTADPAAAGSDSVKRHAFAVPRPKDGNRLDAVAAGERPDSRIATLAGCAAAATAAGKAGAVDCLARPTDADAAPLVTGSELPPPPELPLSAERVRRERTLRVYERRGGTRVVEPCDASWPGARLAKPAMHRVPRSRRARRETRPC